MYASTNRLSADAKTGRRHAAPFFLRAQTRKESPMNFVVLPPEYSQVLTTLLGIVVVFALTELGKLLKADLSGYAAQITAALVSAVVVVANVLLAKVPANLETIVTALLQFILVVLGAFGFYKVYRSIRPKAKG